MRSTPDFIDHLEDGEIIAVGTNCRGEHYGGAAAYAHKHFGLAWGIGEGLSCSTYALPTMEGLEAMRAAVDRFLSFARDDPDKTFLVTRVGCGIAGHSEKQVAPLFTDAPVNCILPEGWR